MHMRCSLHPALSQHSLSEQSNSSSARHKQANMSTCRREPTATSGLAATRTSVVVHIVGAVGLQAHGAVATCPASGALARVKSLPHDARSVVAARVVTPDCNTTNTHFNAITGRE